MKKLSFLKGLVFSALLSFSFFSCKQEGDTEYIYKYSNTFTVTFDANGGWGEMKPQTFIQGKEQKLSKNAFTPPQTGRSFKGWAESSNATAAEYADEKYTKITGNITLYAIWGMNSGNPAGTKTVVDDEKPWPTTSDTFEVYVDPETLPGDDFYKYSFGRWLDIGEGSQRGKFWKISNYNAAGYEYDDSDNADAGVLGNQDAFCNEFKAAIYKKATNNIIASVKEKGNALSDVENGLKAYLKEIDAATTETIADVFAESLVTGNTIFSLEFSCDGRVETYTRLTENGDNYKAIFSGLNDNTIDGFDSLVGEYLDGLGALAKEKKHEVIVSALGITDSSPNAKGEYYDSFVKIYNSVKETSTYSSSENTIGEKIYEKLGFIPENDGDLDYRCLNDVDESTLEDAKRFLKLTYLLSAFDLVASPAAMLDYLPFRVIMLKEFRDVYDPDGSKKDYTKKMCEEFRKKFIERLSNNTWMSSTSKAAAIKKAENIVFYVGYPDEFYESLELSDFTPSSDDLDYFTYCREIYKESLKRYADLFKSLSGIEAVLPYLYTSVMHPLIANAFYSPTENSVCILASNLIDPICNTNYADAYNYAILGASTIGHELCHAFDSNGSMFNENGKKMDWWTVSDKLRYEEKKTQMTELFNMFTTPGTFVSLNGKKTLGENMADFGGLVTAYDLFVEKKIEEGYSGDELDKQRKMFFQSFAIGWGEAVNEEDMEKVIEVDVHAPAMFRVNGTCCLIDDWYDLYDVKKGDKYYLDPGQRVVLW